MTTNRFFGTRTGFLCTVLGLLTFSRLLAADPAWWTDSATRVIDPAPYAMHDAIFNYSPVNLGQLKYLATQARKHLDLKLPPGWNAGPRIGQMVAGFSTGEANNYAPVTLGQLKYVAKPFYDRLREVGYDTQANLVAHGVSGAGIYPWNPATAKEQNYAPATVGQVKLVFSFSLNGFQSPLGNPGDVDGDGILDGNEAAVGSNPGTKDNPALKLTVGVVLQ